MLAKHRTASPRRRGAVAAQVAVTLMVLLGCVALAVDVGYIYDLLGAMQSGVDASALAGASALKKGGGEAKSRATEYAAKNEVAGTGIKSSELTMSIGNWNGLSATFVPWSDTDAVTPNAIRVLATRPGIPLFFAHLLGTSETTVSKLATAVQGGGHCLGIWGLEGIWADGDVVTDSYDARLGNYAGGNIHANGDICSCTDIILNGGVEIHGDAIYGENNALEIYGSSYEIWGVVGDQACNLEPPPFDMAEAAINNDNLTVPPTARGRDPFGGTQWDLTVTGNDSLTLLPGKYYFTSVTIDGQAQLFVTGPTEFYISGDPVYLTGGGVINQTKIPKDLIVYMTSSSATIDGSAGFYGAVVAPETDLILAGTSHFYGVLIGRTLDFDGNTQVHVEESLVKDLFGLESVSPTLVE